MKRFCVGRGSMTMALTMLYDKHCDITLYTSSSHPQPPSKWLITSQIKSVFKLMQDVCCLRDYASNTLTG